MTLRILHITLITSMIAFAGLSCTSQPVKVDDFDAIEERGVLRVVTSYSPISYFIYRGQPLGYEYELLTILTSDLGLDLDLRVARSIEEMMEMLIRGDVDLIADNLTITRERAERVRFSQSLNTTRQVLVQRKPDNWRNMRLHEIDRALIRNPIDLREKEVHLRSGSSYIPRMNSLADEIGGNIQLVVAEPDVTTEDLIMKVARGDIDFTISDENFARINQSFFDNLDVETPVSLPQQLAWAVHPQAEDWLSVLNEWILNMQTQTDYYVIYNKYFENRRAFRARSASDFIATRSGRISDYDNLIRKYAAEIDWDWRLLAALIYQESRFNPNARSWAGAQGLMQLMPATARAHGARNPANPEENIRAGVDFLRWLNNYWDSFINDEEERLLFILASYNVGHGHVQDARRLAEKYDANPDIWHGEVERFMLKKSNPEYFNSEVVHFGYARGLEPVTYVNNILYIYNHYRRIGELSETIP